MAKIIGVLAAERIVAGLVEGNRVAGRMRVYPEPGADAEGLQGVPADEIARADPAPDRAGRRRNEPVEAIGVGFPGIIRDGGVEESPNLQQVKGFRLQEALAAIVRARAGVERRRRHGRRHRRHARTAREPDSRLDAGRRHRLRPLSAGGRRVGRRPHGGDARSQGTVLRLRRRRPSGRHHGPRGHAAPVSRHGAGRSLRRGQGRRRALRRVREALAPRAGGRHRHQHSPGRARANSISPGTMPASSISSG